MDYFGLELLRCATVYACIGYCSSPAVITSIQYNEPNARSREHTMRASNVDVAIVGGGPAGLATAAALRRAVPSATYHVFERARAMREIGASVALSPNGQKALAAIDPALLDAFQSRASVDQGSAHYNLDATKLKFRTDYMSRIGQLREKYGYNSFYVSWFDMQQALYNALPTGSVSVDNNFVGYEEDSQGVWVHFAEKDPIRAKLLVGADGAASAVRRACLGAAACEPQPTGEILYRACLPRPSIFDDSFGQGTAVFLGELDDRAILLLPLSGDRMGMHAPAGRTAAKAALAAIRNGLAKHTADASTRADQGLASFVTQSTGQHLASSEERLARFLNVFQGAPHWLKDTVAANPGKLSENAELRRPATDEHWGKGRVTLVGDAAHLIPPMHGQGTSQAFEDVLQLAHSLTALGLTPDALRHYESERAPRIMALQQYELNHPRQALEGAMLHFLFGMEFKPLGA